MNPNCTRQNPRWLTRAAAVLLAVLGGVGVPAGAVPPAAEVFFQDPSFQQALLSPDGRKVAMLIGAKGVPRRLAVLDLETLKPTSAAEFSTREVRWHRWVDDQGLAFSLEWEVNTQGRAESGPGLFAVNADGSDFRALMATAYAWRTVPEAGVPLLRPITFVVHVPDHGVGPDICVGRVGEVSRQKVDCIDVQRLHTRTGRVTDVDMPLHARNWVFSHGALGGQPLAVRTVQAGLHAWHRRQPLMVVCDGLATRVPVEHGQRPIDAVKPHNRDVEWLVYPNEGHGWSRLENQVDFWNRVERFLALQIGTP